MSESPTEKVGLDGNSSSRVQAQRRYPHPQLAANRQACVAAALKGLGEATFSESVSFVHRPTGDVRLPTIMWTRSNRPISHMISKDLIDATFKQKRAYYSKVIDPGFKKQNAEPREKHPERFLILPVSHYDGSVEAVIIFTGAPRLWRLNWRRRSQFEHSRSSIALAVYGPNPAYYGIEKHLPDGTVQVSLHELVPKEEPAPSASEDSPQQSTRLAGSGRAHDKLLSSIDCIAGTTADVLICGETGSGKEPTAQEIHERSDRRNGPFVKVNVGAIPFTLQESELFGTVAGACTGSIDRKGWFEAAQGGTILLDEFCEASLDLQVKLLRVLEERVVCRVGSTREVRLDIRVVFATNKDPEEMVRQGKLREDLYYRIGQVRLDTLPLRERREDIPDIVRARLRSIARELRPKDERTPRIDPRALALLAAAAWPGNVRELLEFLRSLLVFNGPNLTLEAVKAALAKRKAIHPVVKKKASDHARIAWEDGLLLTGGKPRLMEKHFGVTGNTIRNMARQFGNGPEEKRNGNGASGGNGDGKPAQQPRDEGVERS